MLEEGADRRARVASELLRDEPAVPVDLRVAARSGARECLTTFSSPSEPAPPKSRPASLLSYVWHSPGRIAAVVVLSFSGTLLAILPAVFVGSIINGPITDGDKSALAIDLVVLLVVAVVGFVAMWFGGRLLAVAAQDAMYRLRREVFEHTQILSLRFFDRQPIGDLMSRVTNDLDSVNQFFDKGLYPAINSVFTLISTTVLMFIVSWQLSIAVMLIAPVILVMMSITSRTRGRVRGVAGAHRRA